MFNKLRNRFIITNLIITTSILVVTFSTIYIVAIRSSADRPPIPKDSPNYTSTVSNLISEHVLAEQNASLSTLLSTLIITGLLIEFIVAVLSYYLAENSIKPIKEAYESQKTFIANASHEIKTPLASIQANLEAADIQDNHFIDNVATETAKLTNLNNELLDLARIENAKHQIKLVDVDLLKLAENNSKSYFSRFEERKIDFSIDSKNFKNKKIKLNQTDFNQIFNILLDNAVKYCDKKITVTITDNSIAISNDGAKIKKSDIAHIFERFYQADKSAEGVGLGLSIAKTIANQNDWNLTATSDKITTFTIRI